MKSKNTHSWIIMTCLFVGCSFMLSGCEKEEVLSAEELCSSMEQYYCKIDSKEISCKLSYVGSYNADFECVADTFKGVCTLGGASIIFQVDIKKDTLQDILVFGSALYNSSYESVGLLCANTNSEFGPDHVSRCGSIKLELSVFGEEDSGWFIPSVRFALREKNEEISCRKYLEENIRQISMQITYYPVRN